MLENCYELYTNILSVKYNVYITFIYRHINMKLRIFTILKK